MRRSRVSIGDKDSPTYDFFNEDIIDIEGVMAVSLVGEELSADTLTVTVNYNDEDSELRTLAYGTSVWYYNNSILVGQFYATSVERVGVTHFKIMSTSVIGLLGKETFYGGLYNGATFRQVVEEIIGTNGLQRYARLSPVYTSYRTFKPSFASIANTYMNYRLKAKFKFNKFDPVTSLSSKTSIRAVPIGTYIDPQYSSYFDYGNYCIYADFTRASTSDPWPQTAEFFFCYGDQVFSLGTPALGTEFNIDVNPGLGSATINGVTYQIQAGSSSKQTMLQTWGSGFCMWGGAQSSYCYCYLELGEMEVYDGSGNLVFNPEYVVERKFVDDGDRSAKIMNMVDRAVSTGVSGISGDYASTDLPGFENQTALQIQTVNSIVYDENIENISIYGHIPICTKREALYQLLFATGVSLTKGKDGEILFTGLYNYEPEEISSDDIYIGGSVEYLEDTYKIQITEHSYYYDSSVDAEEIYKTEGTSASGNYIAVFEKMCNGITASGLTIYVSNVNAALVSGIGSINGKPYKHTETIIERDISDNPDGETVTVTDATLITLHNSETVADRLQSYYSTAKKIENGISVNGQKCGRKYSFLNPFRELVSGYLAQMAITKVSAIIKATCKFITDFTPINPGGTFDHCEVLTGSGTFTVPAEVFEKQNPRIRVVIIGGGTGGESGYAGAPGEQSPIAWVSASGGEGGEPGDGGEGGKVYTVTIDNPDSSYSFACGEGGNGGVASSSHDTNNQGSPGGATTFGSYSSESGARSDDGVIGFFDGKKYGAKNIKGKKGANGGYTTIDGEGVIYWYYGANFPTNDDTGYYYGSNYSGGLQGYNVTGNGGLLALGGCGGGAAAGQKGSDGGAGSRSGNTLNGGNGGKGADALYVPPTYLAYVNYGCGGIGGCGGGGGGCSGTTARDWYQANPGTPGAGGKGGVGGKGGAGCVLVYY